MGHLPDGPFSAAYPYVGRTRYAVRAVRIDRSTVLRFVTDRDDPGESVLGARVLRRRNGVWRKEAAQYFLTTGCPETYSVARSRSFPWMYVVVGYLPTRENTYCDALLYDSAKRRLTLLTGIGLNIDASGAARGRLLEEANRKWIADPKPPGEPLERTWRIDFVRRTAKAGPWREKKWASGE